MSEKLNSTVPKKEAINPHESYDSFLEDIRSEYGEEFVLTVIGFSKEKYQEMTPFGVNYEKNIREFVKTYPSYSGRLKQDYENATGKPHRLIEKALAQNEYLEQTYGDSERKSTDLSIPEEKRVYYDPDGYPNLQIDPTFYRFYTEKINSGISSKQEILSLFSKEFPEKSYAYKIPLRNRERWEFKESKSERLSEIIREQGINASARILDCNGVSVEAIVFNQEPTTEKKVRIYRGVVSADQTILRQLPYAARGKIEINGPSPDSSHNYLTSTIQEVPDIQSEVSEIAANPNMELITRYAEKMRAYFIANNMTAELEHLESTLIKFGEGILEGVSLEAMLSIEQVSGGMYTAQYLIAPFVSATPNINEAWTYGRGGVIVYEIPESELKNLSSRSECMINGVVDEKFISMFIYNHPGISNATQLEGIIGGSSPNQVYSREELDEVGSRILNRRLEQEEKNNPENRKAAMRILIENYVNKYPLAEINAQEFLSEVENIDFNNQKEVQKLYKDIENKISQKYIEYIMKISTILEISPNIIQRQTELEGSDLRNVVKNFFERFETKKDILNENLENYLPELKIDFNEVIESAINNKTSLNQEVYKLIKNYCSNNQLPVPQELEYRYSEL